MSETVNKDTMSMEVPYEETGGMEKRKKKRTKKKKRKKRLLLWILIAIALISGLGFFAASSFFDVDNISVRGNSYYTGEQIIEIGGAVTGENIFRTDKRSIKRLLLDDPYIAQADISYELPSTVVIRVRERKETAACLYEKNYYVIDGKGFVLKVTADRPGVTVLRDLTVKQGQEGTALEVKENRALNDMLKVLTKAGKSTVTFKKMKENNGVIRGYIYNNLIVRGTCEDICTCIESGKLEAVLYDLYEKNIKYGMISIGADQYCVFSPKIKQKS